MEQKAYYKMIDSLTVLNGVVGLCLDGTLGELNGQQKENLEMAERHIVRLNDEVHQVMHLKAEKIFARFPRGK